MEIDFRHLLLFFLFLLPIVCFISLCIFVFLKMIQEQAAKSLKFKIANKDNIKNYGTFYDENEFPEAQTMENN